MTIHNNHVSDGNIIFDIGNGAGQNGYVANNNMDWQHVVLVFDGTQSGNAKHLKGYINGVQQE